MGRQRRETMEVIIMETFQVLMGVTSLTVLLAAYAETNEAKAKLFKENSAKQLAQGSK